MLQQLYTHIRPDIAIDLGTANTVVAVRGQGIVLQEPSMVAVDTTDDSIRAVGAEAKAMAGRTPEHIVARRPLRDGVIADFDVTEAMIRAFVAKASPRRFLVHPRILICIPSGATPVERQAVIDAARKVRARQAYLIAEPLAAAIGAGLAVDEPLGNMVVDIGGGTTEVAVISLGGIVTQESIPVAGDEMDEAVVRLVRETYNIVIGQRTAEDAKLAIGSAAPLEDESTTVVTGMDMVRGLPRQVELTSQELRSALDDPVDAIIQAIHRCLDATPPELAADVLEHGIVLTGGGSLLRGLRRRIAGATGTPVVRSEDPLTSVARGAALVLANLNVQQGLLSKQAPRSAARWRIRRAR